MALAKISVSDKTLTSFAKDTQRRREHNRAKGRGYMYFRFQTICGVAAILALFLAGAASAQVNTATLLGAVKDSSGASIPGANITFQDRHCHGH